MIAVYVLCAQMFICGITFVSGINYLIEGSWGTALFPIFIFAANLYVAFQVIKMIKKRTGALA